MDVQFTGGWWIEIESQLDSEIAKRVKENIEQALTGP